MTIARADIADPSPLSLVNVKSWLRVEPCDTGQDAIIKTLIEGAKARAATMTGYHFDGQETVEYVRGNPESLRIDPNIDYTIEVHSGGVWKNQSHELIGDTICLPADCSCSCDCSSCDDAPRYRLTCRQKPCGTALESDIATYVLKYVAFHFENRGDASAQSGADIDRILRPYAKVMFA